MDIPSYWTSYDGEHAKYEDVQGEEALEFVKGRNTHCLDHLGDPTGSELYNGILNILDSKDKIPSPNKCGDYIYNLWRDEVNSRGLWRRTSFDSFQTANPDWQIVLNIDELGKTENESWVWKGSSTLIPDDPIIPPFRTLIMLSRGGSDACVVREFDLNTLEFIVDGGFIVEEAKTFVAWKSFDVLLIGTDIMKDGNSLTDSGYPRTIREWQRGTLIKDSTIIFEGEKSDVLVYPAVNTFGKYKYESVGRMITFYSGKKFYKLSAAFAPTASNAYSSATKEEDIAKYTGKLLHVEHLPLDASSVSVMENQLLFKLRSCWSYETQTQEGLVTHEAGSLIAVHLLNFLKYGPSGASVTVLFSPTPTSSLGDFTNTLNYLILEILENVKEKVAFYKFDKDSSTWADLGMEADGAIRGSSIADYDSYESDLFWFTTNSFTQPTKLFLCDASLGITNAFSSAKLVKSLPAMYNSDGLIEQQFHAISEDGTKVPYFLVCQKDMVLNSQNPTLLYGYGGFEISNTPAYSAVVGLGWLQKGGCYVHSNIRGGGEFGPRWHTAALRENRKLAYDDFIAIAQDLIDRKVTMPSKLAIRGGSNGGLLMGNMLVRRPDLFGAIVCAVPLLDMRRYSKLLAGASWMAEYGDPDIEDDWRFLRNYSPYHNIDPSGDTAYPALLVTTSTKDDRVHPYHARCFVKRLLDVKARGKAKEEEDDNREGIFYYENIEGGHGGAADNPQQAFMNALYINFLWKVLG